VYAEAEATTGYVDDPVTSLTGPRKPIVSQISNTKEMVEPNVEDALPRFKRRNQIGSTKPGCKERGSGRCDTRGAKTLKETLHLPDSRK